MPIVIRGVLEGALIMGLVLLGFVGGFLLVRWLWARFIDWLLSSKAG